MRRLLLPVLVLLVAGCSTILPPADAVQIRVENGSLHPFDRVLVVFPSQQEEYGSVGLLGRTSYRVVSLAYRYAYVEVHIGERVLVLQPIDYVGEAPLQEGRYTYVLGVDDALQDLTLALREDR
jgi:hypothetical protein